MQIFCKKQKFLQKKEEKKIEKMSENQRKSLSSSDEDENRSEASSVKRHTTIFILCPTTAKALLSLS